MKNRIINLKKEKSIDFIVGLSTSYLFFRRGIWNSYEQKPIGYIIKQIQKSDYGADIDEDNGIYYVSCPVDSDMY